MQGFCPAPPLPQYPPASEARPPTAAESQKELFLFFGGRRRIPEEILAKPNHGHKKEPVMGVLINKKAAVDDIASDCRTTLTAAEARGGTTQSLAQQYLKGPLGVFDLVEQRLRSAEAVLAPLLAQLDVKDDDADGLLGRISDEIWNDIGRPAQDATFSLLFPDGIGFYTDGPDDEQPVKMELLAELLEANLHPKLDPKKAKALGKQIRDSAKVLRTAVEQTATPRAQVAMLSRARTAIARSLQMALVNLKRHYKATGLSDSEIHSIIPDRSRPAAKPAKEPAPVAPPAAQNP
jgi:hypothetical protein